MMGVITSFFRLKRLAVQLSAYQQDDGNLVYTIEALNADDTWDILDTANEIADGWLGARRAAAALGVPLLPKSTFPGRAA